MTADEYKSEFSMWAISASPLTFTSPLMNCTGPAPPPRPACTVSLVQRTSQAACTLGVSFGCTPDNSSVWTDGGCRGVFACDSPPAANTTCDVDGAGRHVCACTPVGPPPAATCTPWISDLQREILFNDEVIAVNQDVTPQGRPVADGDISVWARALSDGSAAVAFYNENDAAAALGPVDFAKALGWPPGTAATVRDAWAHADLGRFTGAYPAGGVGVTVRPHATHVVRITRV